MSGKKNLHEGNILYFSLKVYKKTGTKKVWQCIPLILMKKIIQMEHNNVRNPNWQEANQLAILQVSVAEDLNWQDYREKIQR